MIHARPDYNRFQDPAVSDPALLSPGSTPVGEDEPVMLFRAQDRYFTRVLSYYADLLDADSEVQPEIIRAVEKQIERARAWQQEHPTKTPDL